MKNILIISFAILYSCENPELNKFELVYERNHAKWFKEPWETPNYWVQVIGLHELTPLSSHSFGAGRDNDFIIELPDIPENIGVLKLVGDSVVFEATPDLEVRNFNEEVINTITLSINQNNQSKELKWGRVSWRIVKFADKHYLRIRDSQNKKAQAFKGFEYFAPNEEFIFRAKLSKYEKPEFVSLNSVINVKDNDEIMGTVSFEYKDQEHKLLVGKNNRIMFTDESSGEETYRIGRYVPTGEADTNGNIILDFNYTFNPPCALSDYTMCLLPPKENHLPFKVLAGEKSIEKNQVPN